MSMITLHNTSHPEVTILSNTFIDNYMPEANGEFVKVYIYLLRALSSAPVSFSLEQMADRLLCTERDILRALKYWAKQELQTIINYAGLPCSPPPARLLTPLPRRSAVLLNRFRPKHLQSRLLPARKRLLRSV